MGKKNKEKRAWLLGLGFDNKDGHTRITTGENFHLIGGSAETHGAMQEKTVKFNEHLKRRGKKLGELSRHEFNDIADKFGMPVLDPKNCRTKSVPPRNA